MEEGGPVAELPEMEDCAIFRFQSRVASGVLVLPPAGFRPLHWRLRQHNKLRSGQASSSSLPL